MKKLFLIITAMVGMANAAQAQLKLHSNGRLSLQTTETPLSPISINSAGNSSYYLYGESTMSGIAFRSLTGQSTGWKYGGLFQSNLSGTVSCVGVRGEAVSANSNNYQGRSYGVMGIAGYSANGKNYGVFGRLGNLCSGAAVYGTIYPTDDGNNQLTYPCAGYFNGDVWVDGDLEVTGVMENPLLLGNGYSNTISSTSSAISYEEPERSDVSMATRLAGLCAIPYYEMQNKNMQQPEEDTTEAGILRSELSAQRQSKKHYALSADRLEKVLPELVYDCRDGSKGINYVEMIPLLVQTIGELNERIAELEGIEGQGSAASRKTRGMSHNDDNPSIVAVPGAFLYQNTPNPFTERTEIRFSLPEDAQNAVICIFDMTGKMLKKMPVSSGETSVSVNGWELGEGLFLYSLVVGGREIDTKRMVISK